ncbi:MAG: peptidoglycan editing factor PgeF [Bacteroidota bacterium]
MPFRESNGLRYWSFESFPSSVLHGVISRRGGVSPAPWESLNVGGTVGDDKARVRENRFRSFSAFERDLASIHDVWQVHSADAVFADAPIAPGAALTQADIILTDRPEVTLYMRFADCVPVLLHDPAKQVIGIAHAGWLGTVRGVARAAVEAMHRRYGSRPADILAGIGPSIGPDHYEVGPDVTARVERAFGQDAGSLIESRGGRTYFDLWAANRLELQRAGVVHIESSGICTACHLEDWFSHRAEKGKTGRFGALMALQA